MEMPITPLPAIGPDELAALYGTVAELLLYPEDRDGGRVAEGLAALRRAPAEFAAPIQAFLRERRAADLDEYLAILELAPPCPLYLGSYIFDEPETCLGAGLSGRNGYMIELAATYRHFGFEMGKNELADFLPAMAEFLAISLEHPERDGIGLRRRFLEKYFRPGLAPMRGKLAQRESPYALLLAALENAAEADRVLHADEPLWEPPKREGRPPATVISYRKQETAAERPGDARAAGG
jgi:nitrate reductase delta subunit